MRLTPGQVALTGGAKSIEIQAVVIRADGRREDLGTIAEWHRNPLRRLLASVRRFFAR